MKTLIMDITIEEFDKKVKPISKDLLEGDFLKNPSIYILERAGNELLKLTKQSGERNNEFNSWLYSLEMDLEIFLEDLVGELQQDYDRSNKRYKAKWTTEKRKVVGFISMFRQKLLENQTTE